MTDTENGVEYVKAYEARALLGIGSKRMTSLLKEGAFTVYERGLNKHTKWLRRDEVEAYARDLRVVKPKSKEGSAA